MIDQLLNDSAYARSLAPTVVDVANTILAADPAIINAVIDADAFGGTVPAEWAGKTYAYLANFIKKAAKETQYADDNGSLDTANNALNNPAAKKLGGALLALADQAHVDLVMNNIWYLRLVTGLELRALDWAYLAGKFSLDAGAVAAINDALANTTAGPDSVPVFGDDFQAVAALDAGTLWTDTQSLGALVATFGNDIEAIWNAAVPYLVPVTCDDGDVCNGLETCDPVTGCVAGTPLVCDDGNACNGAGPATRRVVWRHPWSVTMAIPATAWRPRPAGLRGRRRWCDDGVPVTA